MANARKPKTTKRSYARKSRPLAPTDKWIVGMIDHKSQLTMFSQPHVFTSYLDAVADAEKRYGSYGPTNSFVVFAKVCVISPSRPPVLKTEFST